MDIEDQLEEIVYGVRSKLTSLYSSLRGRCGDAYLMILLSSQKSEYTKLHDSGHFQPLRTVVYDSPWTMGGIEEGQHFLSVYKHNAGEVYVLDPTGDQFHSLKKELNGEFMLPSKEYPWDWVRITSVNIESSFDTMISGLIKSGKLRAYSSSM